MSSQHDEHRKWDIMNDTIKKICNSCEHYDPDDDGTPLGTCVRYPPQLLNFGPVGNPTPGRTGTALLGMAAQPVTVFSGRCSMWDGPVDRPSPKPGLKMIEEPKRGIIIPG